MLIISNPSDLSHIANSHIRDLIALRFDQLGTIDDAELIVVDPGDSVASLEAASACPILTDPFTETRYGDDYFALSADVLEDHGYVYTLLFVTSDDHAVELFIPKDPGIDRDLLAMCREFAIPAVSV